MQDHATSLATLTVEYHHFRRNAKTNDRAARKAAVKRAALGAITRATTPRDMTLHNAASLPSSLKYNLQSTSLSKEQMDQIDLEIADADRNQATTTFLDSEANDLFFIESPDTLTVCPFCGATDFDSCKQKANCQWAAQQVGNDQ